MSFNLPILNILDEIEDPENPKQSLLTRVIWFLHGRDLSVPDIAVVVGVSEHTIYERLPKDQSRREKNREKIEKLKPEIYQMYAKSGNPKEISFDLGIPLYRIYKILAEHKKEIQNGSKRI